MFCEELKNALGKKLTKSQIYVPFEPPFSSVDEVIKSLESFHFDFGNKPISFCPYCGKKLF